MEPTEQQPLEPPATTLRACGTRRTWYRVVKQGLSAWLLMAAFSASVSGQESEPGRFQFPTLGGKQFWTDHFIHGAWRIQQNVVFGHYRLLNDSNQREVSGSYDVCLQRFRELRQEGKIPDMKSRVVISLHGLGRSRESMQPMVDYLAEHGNLTGLNMSYASTRAKIDDHAKALDFVIRNLEDVEQIDLIAHSMGNLVIRHYLHDQTDPQTGRQGDPRIRRIVMLAPPNSGTMLAEKFKDNPLFGIVYGASGQQLGETWRKLQLRLAVPEQPFGIIAGSGGADTGNPLLEGKDDLVVSVQETRLAGAHDFLVVPSIHTTIMDHPETRRAALNFVMYGFFVAADQRRPIAADEAVDHD